jgi:hypothetical protein
MSTLENGRSKEKPNIKPENMKPTLYVLSSLSSQLGIML